ncbi:MAG: UDP-N-acetylglucosamine pyrophosphorylase [Clostridia bacterium]|nr:UDP-N-acetylglucosamine pyrophosphorylase [Clostridia bacterium]
MLTYKTTELYDLSHTLAGPLLERCTYPWEALPRIKDFVRSLGQTLSADDYLSPAEDVWISKTATVAPSAVICGPAIIGHRTEVRTGAFIRGAVLVGEGCVVGNSCELKNAILFDCVQVPHFNYVGDSILGYRSHTGAGAITSNVKSDKTLVTVQTEDGRLETGLKKFGAMLGDSVEVGCNSVLNPGTVIGRNTNIYPLSSVRGTIPPNSIYKAHDRIVTKQERNQNHGKTIRN